MAGKTDENGFLVEFPPIPEEEFCVYGTVYAEPAHADDLEAIYAETTRHVALEQGIVYYCLSRDENDPTQFHFFERYAGKKAFEDHNGQDIIKKIWDEKWIRGIKASFAKAISPAPLPDHLK